MATAYTADTAADIQLIESSSVARRWIRPFSFNIATNTSNAGFVINDTVALCPIPYKLGVLVVDYLVELPILDTNGSPSVALSLGDTNGSAGAFQATFVSAQAMPTQNQKGCITPQAFELDVGGTVTWKPTVRGVCPKQYTVGTLYSGYVAWPTISFMLKITTAAATTATSGTIKGWLGLQVLNNSTVTF